MNENAISEDWFSSIETNSSKNDSKDPIPDAKYYLVHPKDDDTIYIMDKKPDYKEEPFYDICNRIDMQNYLIDYSVNQFNIDDISLEEDNYLSTLGIYPSENSIGYVFGESKIIRIKPGVSEVLASDTYGADEKVAEHYKLFNWHIPILLDKEPFKKYIQENYKTSTKVEEPEVTKEAKISSLNKRLLI